MVFSISGASHHVALPHNIPLAKNRTASEKYSPQNNVRWEYGLYNLVILLLYSFLFGGVIMVWRRFYQIALLLLMFSASLPHPFIISGNILGSPIYGSILAFLHLLTCYIQYECRSGSFRAIKEVLTM